MTVHNKITLEHNASPSETRFLSKKVNILEKKKKT